MSSRDTTVEFALFGIHEGTAGVKLFKHEKWSCPIFGMVTFSVTTEQEQKLVKHPDVQWLTELEDVYTPMIVPAKLLKEIGVDIGEWGFGFLGDVTPRGETKLLLFPTDSGHYIWIHFHVE